MVIMRIFLKSNNTPPTHTHLSTNVRHFEISVSNQCLVINLWQLWHLLEKGQNISLLLSHNAHGYIKIKDLSQWVLSKTRRGDCHHNHWLDSKPTGNKMGMEVTQSPAWTASSIFSSRSQPETEKNWVVVCWLHQASVSSSVTWSQ